MSRTPEERATLRNRFYATVNRAKEGGIPIEWKKFDHWLTALDNLAPEDFTSDDYRITYDLRLGLGFCTESMRFKPSPVKRQKRAVERVLRRKQNGKPTQIDEEVINALLSEQSDRILFAAELTRRLLHMEPGETAGQILNETAQYVGIQLGDPI